MFAHSAQQSLIEASCQKAFRVVSDLVNDRVANNDIALSKKASFNQNYEHFVNRLSGVKPSIARSWLMLCSFSILMIRETTKEQSNYLTSILMSAFIGYLLYQYRRLFGSMPFEYVGTRLLLEKKDSELCELAVKHEMTYIQAERMSPHHSWRLFSSNPLDNALQSREINFFEHNAILRGLFSLKNKSFDCVSISALVMLMLIEQRIPASITRVMTYQPGITSHHYVVVNLSPACKLHDINTWNDDAIVIDPWYGACAPAKEIKGNKDFFDQYPLLDPRDKVISTRIQENRYSSGHLFAVNLFKQLREKYTAEPDYSPTHLEIIFPRLG